MSQFLHYLELPYLLQGILITLQLTGLGLLGGLVLGFVLASMQLSRHRALSAVARGYTIVFRGTPLILQLVFAYDALPHAGLTLSPLMAAGLALAANEATFIAEVFRSGVLGVDKGQVTAGQALGMTPRVIMRRVIAPQAVRLMVPALGNEAVTTLKNSSLASFIAVQELTLRSTQLASSTFDFFSVFFASGVMYLVLTGAISAVQLAAERALDLDRPAPRSWADRLLPLRRPVAAPVPVAVAAKDTVADDEPWAPPAPPEPWEREARVAALDGAPAAVEVGNLHKSYGEHVVLDGLNMTVRTGEVVALLGPSGSGKSTLLRTINHLEDPDSGAVLINGRRLGYQDNGKPLSPAKIADARAEAGVGMVFQHFNLFSHLTALENVAGPLRWVHRMPAKEAEHRAGELLERVGLAHRAGALPRHLSGGQQQRVAIARALAPNPRVLLLDEPTSALDPELVHEVLEVIRGLAREDGLTMLIATHQLRFAHEVADRVVFISNGSVTEEGPAEELLTRPRHPATARFLRVMGAQSVGGVA
ncbi:amino acid ABC transporter permease/ATP-binding protein [Streptomyces chiangmaiensis]|uniref:Amino acid ABC transporter permease/ATP-binding protein n=1 Tax=Streptomyces chiangmaiensis TaxID=766497 RepID=A0ABU7FV16_9ACTN|nr:amino acid ABC transporter permease/ATP-binding protein [Streptomyces chiangmaiensis]MED7827373.1 amino acid ABC transporter permease/ATP-binding protein [Streptomyces chiangmaiensis]